MRLVPAILTAAALAAPLTAQIGDGSTWTDGNGTTATVDVANTPDGTMVTVTSADGFTSAVEGGGANGAGTTVQSFPAGTTTGGGDTFRGRNGKVEKKNANGTWVPMRKAKKKAQRGVGIGSPGQTVTSLPGVP